MDVAGVLRPVRLLGILLGVCAGGAALANITARPEVSVVIFDSRQPMGTGQGVYMRALAGRLTGDELLRGVEVFSQQLVAHGEKEWTVADVQPPARLRMYRAAAQEHYMLRDDRDERIRVSLT